MKHAMEVWDPGGGGGAIAQSSFGGMYSQRQESHWPSHLRLAWGGSWTACCSLNRPFGCHHLHQLYVWAGGLQHRKPSHVVPLFLL